MNSLSQLYVAAHQDEMRKAAANERLAAKNPATGRSFQLGATLRSAWSFLSGPAERPLVLPTLNNYPYRG